MDFGKGMAYMLIPCVTTVSDAPVSSRKWDPLPNQDAKKTFEIRVKTVKSKRD
jgi:hypothetical protein